MSDEVFDQLMQRATDYAVNQLCTDMYVVPFAVVADAKGRITVVTEEAQHIATEDETVSFIQQDLRRGVENGKYSATAVVQGLRFTHPDTGADTDVIQVACEQRSHFPVIGYLPYSIEQGKLVLGSLICEEGENEIFRHGQGG